ncbi:hypothetical protein TorRG33x02_301550 [Trema orientale]|uniref:Uncharacterized protein n=1 Tax=Trema orientale TaxID=63057 RepID=A0A2P5C126_TREOI|nr:hypothetical protein TorRG33x02_301550 [Trema orientale]
MSDQIVQVSTPHKAMIGTERWRHIPHNIVGLKELVEAHHLRRTTTTEETVGANTPDVSTQVPKIQKVPFFLRDKKDFENYYEPRAVSIGPIHHEKPWLQPAEFYKLKLAAQFIRDTGKDTEELYEIIKDNVNDLKDYYQDEGINLYDDDALSWILFLDGCYILQFIYSFLLGELKSLGIENEHVQQNDLFLLENQVPFAVLKLLMDPIPNQFRSLLKNSIEEFIRMTVMTPMECKNLKNPNINIDEVNPAHLLDLLHKVLARVRRPRAKKNLIKSTSHIPEQQSFRNIYELKAAGISLRPSTSCALLRDINFISLRFAAWLELPQLVVDNSTKPMFLNLIAYESCPDNFRTNREVTSYVCFLNSLIEEPDDVKVLRLKKIFYVSLGRDKEVAALFNELAADLVPNPEIYKDVKDKMQVHYDNRRVSTWFAEAYKTYFSSPWAMLTFLAALLGLTLAVVETWFTVKSSTCEPCSNCCNRKS